MTKNTLQTILNELGDLAKKIKKLEKEMEEQKAQEVTKNELKRQELVKLSFFTAGIKRKLRKRIKKFRRNKIQTFR